MLFIITIREKQKRKKTKKERNNWWRMITELLYYQAIKIFNLYPENL